MLFLTNVLAQVMNGVVGTCPSYQLQKLREASVNNFFIKYFFRVSAEQQ